MMPLSPLGSPNCWLSCLLIDPQACGAGPEDVVAHLAARDVEARRTWKPLHLQRAFAGCRTVGGDVAEDLFARGVSLPSGFDLTDEEVRWIAREVAAAVGTATTAGSRPEAAVAGSA